MEAPTPRPEPTRAGNLAAGVATAWLTLGTLGCVGSFPFLFTPEVLANTSMITVPIFLSGWGAAIGAFRHRREEYPTPAVAALTGGVIGLLLGIAGTAVTYFILWP